MVEALHKLAHKHALCLRAALDFSPALCPVGAPRARARARAPGPRCARVVPEMCLSKSLIFQHCACCARRSEASHREVHHVHPVAA
jgi:hypothetical protein